MEEQASNNTSWSERARLVDVERGGGAAGAGREALPPPVWADTLEEAQYTIVRLRRKLEELRAAHALHLQRPTLDEGAAQEQRVARLVADTRRLLTAAHGAARDINAHTRTGKPIERKLASNAVAALVSSLQDISLAFRDAQTSYLRSLTSREERSNAFFELPNFEELSLDDELIPGLTSKDADNMFTFGATSASLQDGEFVDEMFQNPSLNQKQLLAMQEENTKMAEEREQEVNSIVRSIVDLNDIFKDLAHMVNEQGTVLDRIDYNIEQTQVQVHEGFKQLQKADKYQRKNRKMHCIMVLGATIVILVIVLIIVKS